ncbi:TolC family protein [Francisella philomiragia]|uniref:TolC family protein n=1 Tax=Francisella philomiragia TaxID=28110 RepID=UPI001907223B|nr:TolC family protein [Francisella philomiragia]MBK2024762.1 TolC family protein [Francisella philomiragia]
MKKIFNKQKRKILITLYLFSSLLPSCSFFDPKYEKPKVEIPSIWKNQPTGKDNMSKWNLPNLAWWRDFHDASLNGLITTALHDNENLQISIGNILQADAEINKANYAWLPTASVGGGGFMVIPFDVNASGALKSAGSQPVGGSLAGIIPSYTINIAREYKMGEITRLGKEINVSVKDAVRLSIISKICIAYFSLLSAKQQLKLQSEYTKNLENLYKYTNNLRDSGVVSSLETEERNQTLEIEKGKLAIINNDIVVFENTLRAIIGKNPGSINTYTDFNKISTDIKTPANMPSQVLKNRPDIAIAEYKLKLSNANIGLARSQFFPNIDLTGAFGNATLALGELATANLFTWAYFAQAAMPVFNMSILADSDKAKAQFYEAYYNYVNTLHEAFRDVENQLSENQANKVNFKNVLLSVNSAKVQQNIYSQKYDAGIISEIKYIEKRLNTIYQEMQMNRAKLNLLVSTVGLYEALGSGYSVDDNIDPDYSNPAFTK